MAHRKKLVGPPFLQQAGGAGQGVALKDVDALAEHVEAGQGVGGLVCVELELLVVEPAEVAEALVAPVAAVGEGVGVDALAGHPGKVLGGLHTRAEVDALGLEVGMPPGFVGQLEADALERLGLVGLAHAGAVVPAVHVEEGAGVEAVVAVLGGVSAREAQGRHQAVVGRGLDVFGVDGELWTKRSEKDVGSAGLDWTVTPAWVDSTESLKGLSRAKTVLKLSALARWTFRALTPTKSTSVGSET